jgi:hypothetical protein
MASDDRDQPEPAQASCDGHRYAIRVQAHLDAYWSEWLDGMTITHEEGGVTLLEGPVVDPSALHGLFNKLLNMRAPILWLQRLEPISLETPPSEKTPQGKQSPS